MKRLRTIDWEDGAAEILSFCMLLPFILIIILTFCNLAMLLQANNLVEYSLYTGARAAAISINNYELTNDDRISIAEDTANDVAGKSMATDGYNFVDSNPGKRQWSGKISVVQGDGGENPSSGLPWAKGTLFEYRIQMGVPNFLGPAENKVESAIVMMVETPAIDSKLK